MNKQMQDYINQMRATNHSDEQIREKLEKSGWSGEQIKEFLSQGADVTKTQEAKSPKSKRPLFFMLAAFILIFIIAGTAIYWWLFYDATHTEKEVAMDIEEAGEDAITDVDSEEAIIEWALEPQKLSGREAFASFAEKYLADARVHYKEDSFWARANGKTEACTGTACLGEIFGWLQSDNSRDYGDNVYFLGTILSEEYKNSEVYFVDSHRGGHCSICARYRMLLTPEDELIFLTEYSNNPWLENQWEEDYFKKYITFEEEINIPDLHPPKEVAIPDSSIKIAPKHTPHNLFSEWAWAGEPHIIFEDPEWGPVFGQKEFYGNEEDSPGDNWGAGDIGIRLKDGTVFQYQLDPPFLSEEKPSEGSFGLLPAGYKISAKFIDSENPIAPGQLFDTGDAITCGGGSVGYRINTEITISDIFPKAETEEGEILHVLNFDHAYARELYDSGFILYTRQNEEASYEDFLSIVPIVFWEDPFGRLVELRNIQAVTGAECGGGMPPSPLTPR